MNIYESVSQRIKALEYTYSELLRLMNVLHDEQACIGIVDYHSIKILFNAQEDIRRQINKGEDNLKEIARMKDKLQCRLE